MRNDFHLPQYVQVPVWIGFCGPTLSPSAVEMKVLTFELTAFGGEELKSVRGAAFVRRQRLDLKTGIPYYVDFALGYRCPECKRVFFGHQLDKSFSYLQHGCTKGINAQSPATY